MTKDGIMSYSLVLFGWGQDLAFEDEHKVYVGWQ